jgi:hypothetical protein
MHASSLLPMVALVAVPVWEVLISRKWWGFCSAAAAPAALLEREAEEGKRPGCCLLLLPPRQWRVDVSAFARIYACVSLCVGIHGMVEDSKGV